MGTFRKVSTHSTSLPKGVDDLDDVDLDADPNADPIGSSKKAKKSKKKIASSRAEKDAPSRAEEDELAAALRASLVYPQGGVHYY